MKELYITNFVEIEQNPFANARTSFDGGGYHQPLINFDAELNGIRAHITIDDTSCGGFGERFITRVQYEDHTETLHVDTMDNWRSDEFNSIDPNELIEAIVDSGIVKSYYFTWYFDDYSTWDLED